VVFISVSQLAMLPAIGDKYCCVTIYHTTIDFVPDDSNDGDQDGQWTNGYSHVPPQDLKGYPGWQGWLVAQKGMSE